MDSAVRLEEEDHVGTRRIRIVENVYRRSSLPSIRSSRRICRPETKVKPELDLQRMGVRLLTRGTDMMSKKRTRHGSLEKYEGLRREGPKNSLGPSHPVPVSSLGVDSTSVRRCHHSR